MNWGTDKERWPLDEEIETGEQEEGCLADGIDVIGRPVIKKQQIKGRRTWGGTPFPKIAERRCKKSATGSIKAVLASKNADPSKG
eukprot:15223328-Ditylum_brightwellii.AAC.1